LANQKVEDVTPALPTIGLTSSVTVKQLADLLNVEPVKVIKQFMRKGIMVNINQVLDFDTAATVVADFGYAAQQKKLARPIYRPPKKEEKKGLQARPPVITVMGHVDHGKTTLLDSIRQTNVTATEAGAITQHIGAYQVELDARKVTFLDTPGHEAFTAMRAHGAQVTDIVVLVVAADDGVMPQTVEAIDHARAAGVPILVAINKIDKPNANPDRVKQQLAELGLLPEEWGGDVICVAISAKKGQGTSDLLENLLLVAEMLELKAEPNHKAEGVVIEAKLDKSKGPIGTLLVQKGSLRVGDALVIGDTQGKIKALFDYRGKQIRKAEPATPVEALGISSVPLAGDSFTVVADEHEARRLLEKREVKRTRASVSLTSLSKGIGSGKIKELNIILKTDVQGSIEPIKQSLEQLSTEEVKVNVIHAASGSVTDSDMLLASASKGIVIGFNVSTAPGAKQLAEREGVSIHHYNVIYELVEDVDKVVKGMLEPTYVDVVAGRAEVRAVFAIAGKGKVAGAYIREGEVWRDAPAKILRRGKVIHESRVSSLKRFKENVRELSAGLECGIGITGFTDFQIGDSIELYRQEKAP
jgi:translation initiation factor IF-2